jgi:prealbumin domain-containing protein
MFQMSIRASRATRLLAAVGVAWLGLALSAQAAHATYSRVQIVKINQGGDANDVFTFDTSLKPAASPASFNLKGGQSSSIYGVECNVGSSCTSQWGNSVQTITERPAAGYTLTAIACYHTQGTNGWPSEPNTSSALDTDTTSDVAARKINFKLNWWEWVKCYVTNTRDTGTIKVTKKLVPATDSGKFNLLIDGQAKATDVGDGGTTGVQTVLPGTHTVGEAAGTATDLSNYDSSTSCVDKAHTATPADTDGSLAVAKGDQWDCVITNTRKSTPTPPPPPQEPPTTTPPVSPPVQAVSPTPQVRVSPARVRPGSAKLRGPSGCPTTSAVAATVSGRRIVKVTFYVDGKKVKTLTKANRNGRWVLPMNVKRFAFGTHRVRVTVQFARSSQTKAKTLRLSFSRCHSAVVKPQFTG